MGRFNYKQSPDVPLYVLRGEYEQGSSVTKLAQKHGLSEKRMHVCLLEAGTKIEARKRKKETEETRAAKVAIDLPAAVKAYQNGDPIRQIAHQQGISRKSLTTKLVRAGVELRSSSDQMYIRHQKLTADERMARVALAHAAVRGSKQSISVLRKKAGNRQVAGKMTPNELAWRDALIEVGIYAVPQFALDKYSIDLAIPDARVAVEVQCGWHYTGRKAKADEAKKQMLDSAYWLLYCVPKTPTVAHIKRIKAAVDIRRNTPYKSAAIQDPNVSEQRQFT